jgi:hypothetical protein
MTEIDLSKLVEIIRDNAFTNILSLIGGFFGLIAFIMQIPRNTKLLLFNSEKTNIFLDKDGSTIDKIELCFSIQNKSKKNCIITDIFAKIYENDSYTPDVDIYHVTTLKRAEEKSDFTILYIPADEVFSYTIELSDNLSERSKKRFQNGRSYTIEMYCVKDNKKVIMFSRSESFSFNEIDNNCIKLKSITKTIERDKFENKIKKKKKAIRYNNGIIYTFLYDLNHFIKYKLLRRPFWITFDLIKWLILQPYYFLLFVKNTILSNTIFISYGSKTYKNSAFFTDREEREKMKMPLKKLSYYLNNSVKKINKKNNLQNIIIEIKEDEINLEKNGLKLHIYLPGGDNIIAQELKEGSKIFVQFSYNKNYLFYYWYYNKRIINIREMASIILNYFLDWSLYKK